MGSAVKTESQTPFDLLVDQRLKDTVFAVEASGIEQQYLWQEWHSRVKWNQLNPCLIETIGRINDRPIAVELRWVEINDRLVMFYEATSVLVDCGMVEEWVRNAIGNRTWDGGRTARVNASNFYLCLEAIKELNQNE